MPNQRNSWCLCRNHKNCEKCKYTLECYKRKALKHSFNASRTKYALMCFLEGNTQEHEFMEDIYDDGGYHQRTDVKPVPLQDDPVFTGTAEEVAKQEKDNQLYNCGICSESMVKQGKRKPVIYNCGHSNCADCFNGWCKSQIDTNGKVSCPYCRQEITKAIRLFVD